MLLRENDIIVRRERNGNYTTWIREEVLIAYYSANEDYLRKKARPLYRETVSLKKRNKSIMPDTGNSWRYAKFHKDFYYDYDRIPACGLPPKSELQQLQAQSVTSKRRQALEGMVETALSDTYRTFLHHYNAYNDIHANALSRAAAVLWEANNWIKTNGIDTRKNTFFRDLATVVGRLEVSYLPKNYRRLKEKVVAVHEGQPVEDIIDLPRAGNRNALRNDDKEILSWLFQMRAMPQNYTGAHIIRKLRKVCAMAGKDTPSQSWFEAKLAENKTKFLTGKARHGSGRYGVNFEGYTPLKNALFPADCWQVDGTRINFIGHTGPDGKEQFLYIIAVVDVHSGDVIGWHFDTKEDRWGYTHALKMAVEMTGHLPWELVVDRFPGHNTTEWQTITARMERLGTKVTITSKKTGKAKAERFFGTLQSVFLMDSPYYYGEGIQSKREAAHRSPEYLKKIRKEARAEGWSFDDAWRETVRCLEAYRNTPYADYSRKFRDVTESPRELYTGTEAPNAVKVEVWDRIELFGLEKRVTIRRAGVIATEIQKMSYTYQVDEYKVLSQYKRVALCYDLDDLGTVYLFEDSDEINRDFLGTATELRAVQMYGPDADKTTVGKAEKRIKDIEEQRDEELHDLIEGGSEVELMLAGFGSKPDAMSAENRWLNERLGEWKTSEGPRILNVKTDDKPVEDDDDGDDIIDVRSMY